MATFEVFHKGTPIRSRHRHLRALLACRGAQQWHEWSITFDQLRKPQKDDDFT